MQKKNRKAKTKKTAMAARKKPSKKAGRKAAPKFAVDVRSRGISRVDGVTIGPWDTREAAEADLKANGCVHRMDGEEGIWSCWDGERMVRAEICEVSGDLSHLLPIEDLFRWAPIVR